MNAVIGSPEQHRIGTSTNVKLRHPIWFLGLRLSLVAEVKGHWSYGHAR